MLSSTGQRTIPRSGADDERADSDEGDRSAVSDREDDEGDRRTTGAETRPDDRREDGGSTHREGDRAFVIERE